MRTVGPVPLISVADEADLVEPGTPQGPAKRHEVSLKATVEEGLFYSDRKAPSKARYANALARVMKPQAFQAELKEMPVSAPVPKKRRKRSSSWLW